MKYIFLLFSFALFFQTLCAENLPKKFSLNLKLSFPVLKSDVPQFIQSVDPGVEVLYMFPLINRIRLGTGIGFDYGHHVWNKDHTGVTWGEGEPRKYSNLYVYHLNFVSAEIPFYLEILPIKTRVINALNFGFDLGWHNITNFFLERATLPQEPELNKTYISVMAGGQIPLLRFKQFPINLQPFIKYRYYLTDRNKYQTSYFMIGIKLNTNF
jgi:hypothetical protein